MGVSPHARVGNPLEPAAPGAAAAVELLRQYPSSAASGDDPDGAWEGVAHDAGTCWGSCCRTRELRTLWTLFSLTLTFATAQMAGAVVANSLTLFSDSGTMVVDAGTYAVNIYAARLKTRDATRAAKVEVRASAVSVGVLIVMTAAVLVDASQRLCCSSSHVSESDNVDGRLVLGFSLANLVIDIVMCTRFALSVRRVSPRGQLNMASAFAHLAGDTLRSLASVVAGSLELNASSAAESLRVDGALTVVVCVAILFGAAVVARETVVEWRALKSDSEGGGMGDAEVGMDDVAYPARNASSLELSAPARPSS